MHTSYNHSLENQSMKVYHVEGIRHCAVVFAENPEDAIAQATEQGSVGDWEAPSAIEVPPPEGYRIKYDPQKAKLRGHHLICLNFFRGEGYSEDFIENIYSVIEKEKIEIVNGPDDVCARCPYLGDNICSSREYTDEKIMLQDKEALKLLRLSPGMVVDRRSVLARIPQIIEKWKEKFCLDCGYRKVCF